MGLNSISKKMAKSKLSDTKQISDDKPYESANSSDNTPADQSSQPKTLADRFAGDKNLIRLTPAQKKMYRKEGYTDVDNYKTILAPGTIFRPGYKPIYDEQGTVDKSKMNAGIETSSEIGIGVTMPSVTINGKKFWDIAWAKQNADVKPSLKQSSSGKGKGKFNVTPTAPIVINSDARDKWKNMLAEEEVKKNSTSNKPNVGNDKPDPILKSVNRRMGILKAMLPPAIGEWQIFNPSEEEVLAPFRQRTYQENNPIHPEQSINPLQLQAETEDKINQGMGIFSRSSLSTKQTFGDTTPTKQAQENIATDKGKKFSSAQEAIINKHMKENPAYTRQQIIDTLISHKII